MVLRTEQASSFFLGETSPVRELKDTRGKSGPLLIVSESRILRGIIRKLRGDGTVRVGCPVHRNRTIALEPG